MADIPKIDVGRDAGPRNIEMRFTMLEMLVLHSAFEHRHETLAKNTWWASKHCDLDQATCLQRKADENHDPADRLFKILDGIMGPER